MSGGDVAEQLATLADAIDLTEYEIEAYVAVIEHGELTASEIASETELPQPRVYDTVRRLADRGLVELRESRPLRVLAIDPAEAWADLQDNVAEVTEDLADRYVAPARENEGATLVKSRSSIFRYFREIIAVAEIELTIVLTPPLLDRFRDELRAAIERDVRISLIVAPAAAAPDPANFPYDAVATVARARRGVTTPVLAVADGEYSIYASQGAVQEDGNQYAAIFNRSALGFLVLGFFETVLWSTADLILRADPPARSLPRRYASLRRCIQDARDRDGRLFARVAGRDVVSGEHRQIAGAVASMRLSDNQEIATMEIDTEDGPVTVGGRVAAYEDIEAHEIELLDRPP